jgi:hypothetical protein
LLREWGRAVNWQNRQDNSEAIRTHPINDLGCEEDFLRYRIKRLRTILRYARDPRAIAGLKEVIAESESRLTALEIRRHEPPVRN